MITDIKHPRTTADRNLQLNLEVQIPTHINQDKPEDFRDKLINEEHRQTTLPENLKPISLEHGPIIHQEDQEISDKEDLNQTSIKEDGRYCAIHNTLLGT